MQAVQAKDVRVGAQQVEDEGQLILQGGDTEEEEQEEQEEEQEEEEQEEEQEGEPLQCRI